MKGKFENIEPLWPYRLKIRVEEVCDKPKHGSKSMLVTFAINKLSKNDFREIAHAREHLSTKHKS